MAEAIPEGLQGPSSTKDALDEALATAATPEKGAARASDDYRINIPTFEGPLDLLLHLIRKEQINIYDIPVSRICKSYLEHLELMKQFDVNVAGEFMVMASTLTYMKSLILLPVEEAAMDEENDPRMPLVQQLLEYERFKRAADQVDAIPWLYRDIYPRSPSAIQDAMPVESLMDAPIEQVDTYALLVALKVALTRTTKKPLQISTDPTSIKDKVLSLTELMDSTDIIDFRMLLPQESRSKDVIVSFLAVLELARLKFIEILQHENFGPIQIRSVRSLRELNQALLDQY